MRSDLSIIAFSAPEHRADERVPELRDQAVRPGGVPRDPGPRADQGDHRHPGLCRYEPHRKIL